MKQQEYSVEMGGQKLTAIFSDLANQASGSVLVRYGETLVLATAVMGEERTGIDFFPLTVEYEERFYAAGKILGGRFNKREGKPSDEAVLAGRIIDRTIRPLFDQHIRREVQVIITVLSIDEHNDPDLPAVIGASLALSTSNIPWKGPVSAVRLGLNGESYTVNPSYAEREGMTLDLLVCGQNGKINMIEAEGKEVPEDKIAAAFTTAVSELNKLETWQKEIIKAEGKEKLVIEAPVTPEEIKTLFTEVVMNQNNPHEQRGEWEAAVTKNYPDFNLDQALGYFENEVDKWLHNEGLKNKRRVDGRKFDEVRPLFAQAGGLSEVVHGTGIFYRGGTHILSTLTLGGPKDSLLQEGMEVRGDKRFMHHYNFPPFSTGETGRVGNPSRRSIGHGALAEKSLRGVLPSREEFPYTIRLVSEALASNGSTSMGSVCGSSLALMDGGVPIKAPVAGIAIGLLQDEEDENNYQILTDIQGPEDHYGDMDFKVAGTKDGITGIQLDIKIGGISTKILTEALVCARAAREQILSVITAALAAPRATLKPSAPQIITLKIPVDKIGAVIGAGGKVIHKISETTGAEIEIEEDGSVYITGKGEGAEQAKKQIESITHEYKVGEKFDGEVVKILDFGAFVKIGFDADGLVHISELAPFRVNHVTDVVKEGDKIPVVVKEVDERGRISLSLKQADPDYATRKGVKPSTNHK